MSQWRRGSPRTSGGTKPRFLDDDDGGAFDERPTREWFRSNHGKYHTNSSSYGSNPRKFDRYDRYTSASVRSESIPISSIATTTTTTTHGGGSGGGGSSSSIRSARGSESRAFVACEEKEAAISAEVRRFWELIQQRLDRHHSSSASAHPAAGHSSRSASWRSADSNRQSAPWKPADRTANSPMEPIVDPNNAEELSSYLGLWTVAAVTKEGAVAAHLLRALPAAMLMLPDSLAVMPPCGQVVNVLIR